MELYPDQGQDLYGVCSDCDMRIKIGEAGIRKAQAVSIRKHCLSMDLRVSIFTVRHR